MWKVSLSFLEIFAVVAVAVTVAVAVAVAVAVSRRNVVRASRSNPFISMGLSRVSEGPSTDDVIDVGCLMPYWACIQANQASERAQGNTRSSTSLRVSYPSSPRTVNGHVVESIIEWPSFSVFLFGLRSSRMYIRIHVQASRIHVHKWKLYPVARVIKVKNPTLLDSLRTHVEQYRCDDRNKLLCKIVIHE